MPGQCGNSVCSPARPHALVSAANSSRSGRSTHDRNPRHRTRHCGAVGREWRRVRAKLSDPDSPDGGSVLRRQHHRRTGAHPGRQAVRRCGSSRSSSRTVLVCRGRPPSRPSPKDGYTLMLTSNGHTIARAINKTVPFDPVKDFAGVSIVASAPVAALVPADFARQDAEGFHRAGAKESGQAQFRLGGRRQHDLPRHRSHAAGGEAQHGACPVQGRA